MHTCLHKDMSRKLVLVEIQVFSQYKKQRRRIAVRTLYNFLVQIPCCRKPTHKTVTRTLALINDRPSFGVRILNCDRRNRFHNENISK